jgi:hypothetical protein
MSAGDDFIDRLILGPHRTKRPTPKQGTKSMDNQHKKISGYRDLTQAEIDMMNEIKEAESRMASLIEKIRSACGETQQSARDIAISRTEFENGFMRLVRAVARPNTPWK